MDAMLSLECRSDLIQWWTKWFIEVTSFSNEQRMRAWVRGCTWKWENFKNGGLKNEARKKLEEWLTRWYLSTSAFSTTSGTICQSNETVLNIALNTNTRDSSLNIWIFADRNLLKRFARDSEKGLQLSTCVRWERVLLHVHLPLAVLIWSSSMTYLFMVSK